MWRAAHWDPHSSGPLRRFMLHLLIHQRLLVYFTNLHEPVFFSWSRQENKKKKPCELGVTGTVGRQKSPYCILAENIAAVVFLTRKIKRRILKNRVPRAHNTREGDQSESAALNRCWVSESLVPFSRAPGGVLGNVPSLLLWAAKTERLLLNHVARAE